jgi:uncharacterized protein (DUF983 family)
MSQPDRPLGPAIAHGLRGRCPACGEGTAFSGFLAVRPACEVCGEALHHHRADDAPAWATMLLVGHLMIPLILVVRGLPDLPVLFHSLVWPLVALALCLALLRPVKGAILGWQWACRMHGFGD